MEAVDHGKYEEAVTIGVKIIGFLLAFISLRWLIRIFRGPDRIFDADDLKKLVALLLFVWAFIYIVVKEGQRTDLTHEVYGIAYLSVISGSLLVVLHLESALDKILQIILAMKGITSTTRTESVIESVETKTELKEKSA